MPIFEFTSPDGKTYEIEGPEGATEAQAFDILQQQLATVGQAGEQQYGDVVAETPVPQSSTRQPVYADTPQQDGFLRSALTGFVEPIQNLENRAEDTLSLFGVDLDATNRALGFAGRQEREITQAAERERAGDLGRITGNIVGTLPAAALRGGAAVVGAVQGAALSDADTLSGLAGDAALGAVGGVVGDRAVRGIARAIQPRVAPYVQQLLGEGVDLTPGQIARSADTRIGNIIAGTEDRIAGLPVVGDLVQNARRRGVEQFNRAAINRGLNPIGASLPDNVPAGSEAVRFAGDRLSAAYDDVLPNIRVSSLDDQFNREIGDIGDAITTLPTERQTQLQRIIENDVTRFVGPEGISGEALKQVERRLGARARRYSASSDADAQELGALLADVQSSIRSLAARQNPEYAGRLQAINEGWANLVRVEMAARGAREGVFSPNQLRTAVRQADSSVRGRNVARGEALMQDLSEAGSAVLPSQVPDSGTAGRAALALGAGGFVSPTAALLAGAASLPYASPNIGRAVQSLLTGRQGPAWSAAAGYVERLARPAGIATAPLIARPGN